MCDESHIQICISDSVRASRSRGSHIHRKSPKSVAYNQEKCTLTIETVSCPRGSHIHRKKSKSVAYNQEIYTLTVQTISPVFFHLSSCGINHVEGSVII